MNDLGNDAGKWILVRHEGIIAQGSAWPERLSQCGLARAWLLIGGKKRKQQRQHGWSSGAIASLR